MLSILQGLKASQYVIGLLVLHFHWSSYFFIGRGLKTIKFRSLWEVIWQSLYLKTSKLYHNCNIMTHLKQIIWYRSCRKVTTASACAHCLLFEKNFVCLHLSTTLKTNFQCVSCHVNHRTHQTFPMARPNCLMRDFTNLNKIYKAHRTNVWWIMKVFQVHCVCTLY